MPPPCCMVRAASRRLAKMPPMSSGIVPMTKQLNRVTVRPVPAPARMRPAGRNWKSDSASANRPVHSAGLDFDFGKRFRDARPGVADGFVHRLAVEHLQPVFHIPDLLGYGCYGRHSALPCDVPPGRIEPPNTFKNKSFRDLSHWQGELYGDRIFRSSSDSSCFVPKLGVPSQ